MKKDTFLYVSAFLMDSCFAIVGICVPLYALQFGATYDDLGHINAWGALAYSVTSLVSGRLSDRMGYRQIMRIGSFCLFLAFVGYIGVNRIWHFILLSVLTAVAIAHYWPPMQAYLGRGKSRDVILPALGRFNVAWTLGVFIGPAAGGVLFAFHPFSGFILSGFFVLLLFLGLIVVPILESEPGVAATRSVIATSGHFLPLALLANFATFFAIGLIRALFPKLATDLGISPNLLGYLLALIAFDPTRGFLFDVADGSMAIPSVTYYFCSASSCFWPRFDRHRYRADCFCLWFFAAGRAYWGDVHSEHFLQFVRRRTRRPSHGYSRSDCGEWIFIWPAPRRPCCRAFQCAIALSDGQYGYSGDDWYSVVDPQNECTSGG